MQARRILGAIGAVALVAVVLVVVRVWTLQPVAPVGDVAASAHPLPGSDDQSLLDRVGVQAQDLGPGELARLLDQGDQLSEPTLDLCSLSFASEKRRQARRQVAVSDSSGDAVFSTEAVLYQDQAGAAEAMAEARGAASRCPPGPVAGPTPTDPQLRWRVRGDTDLGGGRPSGLDRLGLTVQASEAGSPA